MSVISLGLDIGATKIAAGLISADGEVRKRKGIASQAESSESLASNLESLITEVVGNQEISSIGIGSAGPIDIESGTISPVNIPNWREFPVVQFVKDVTKKEKVTLMGDVVALVYGEYKLGSVKGKENILGVVVSTGIGGGLILSGEVYSGSTWNGGFIGHTVVGGYNDLCSCGGTGCVESLASGPSMTRWALNQGIALPKNATFFDIAQAAREGNEIAIKAIERGVDALALAIANASALLDLDAVVLGGGVAESGDIFWTPLQEAFVRKMAHNNFLIPKELTPCHLGTSAGIIGAALYSMRLS
jgi:glucokinase